MGGQSSDARDSSLETMGPPPPKRGYNKYATGCAMLASLASILLGYDIGVMSGAELFIKDDLKLNDTQIEILLGVLNLYSLVGSFAAGFTSDWIGRRYTIVFAATIFFTGALLMGFATNYAFLMVGRFVAGIGVGYALMIAPTYTAEVAPASSRGFLTSFPEVFINSGILLGYVSNYAFSHLRESLGWRLMLGVGAIPSVFLGLGVLAMPESPRWLIMQGRLAEARKVLEKTSDTPEEAKLRLSDIKIAAGIPEDCDDDVVPMPKKTRSRGVWKDLLVRPTPSVRRVLIAAVGLHFFQQASGIDSVVLYSPKVFEKAGIQGNTKLLGTTVAVGFTKTLFILVATFLLDRVGRRPLLLTSFAGMILSLAGLGLGLTAAEHHTDGHLPWAVGLSIACVLAYVAFFSIGAGPITWVYSSEIFPLRLRAVGASIGVAVNRVTSGVITMTFISLYKAISLGGSFFLYGGIAAVAWVFFFTYLPETRGRTLEDMEELFGKEKEVDKQTKEENRVEMVNASNRNGNTR
ncbi:unnamed protein product [Musa acuminata subsp. malaccensis]|uniref:(wild Malaysian banana) hypothetical protein n=1 Tax=Musa acuminata subsp. malaccensis TaxID=214687 RepID=A0A804HUP6_MUSAM|nr:PREDICTED: putative polyol transporter 1 [Musa acuminata subsp. malaccensis]CAG1859684.1 unnamed protein product [Musa acuminata subsp. malaccensis]